MRKIRPFYAQSTVGEDRTMVICVAANCLIVGFCAAYIALAYPAIRPSSITTVSAILIGYFLADVASGLVHWATDTWFSERQFGRLIAIAREHHTHPSHILGYRFLENATLGSAPSALFIGPLALLIAFLPRSKFLYAIMIVFFLISLTLLFGTSLHNIGHRKAKSFVVKVAQKMRLVITPAYHHVHHSGDQTTRYCTVNGWANPLLDRIGFWRGLERLISRITGAVPREDDVRWQSHYRETGEMIMLQRE
jgi:ubiquitin-conjugating enzyme E2 variant